MTAHVAQQTLGYDPNFNNFRMPVMPQLPVPLTSWPSGHGWGGSGTGGTFSDDTSDFVYGLQSLKCVTAGNNAVVAANKTSGLTWNLSTFATGGGGARIRLAIKCDNWTGFLAANGGCTLYFTSDNYSNFFTLGSAVFTVSTGGLPLDGEWAVVEYSAENINLNATSPNLAAIVGSKIQIQDGGAVCTFHFGALWLIPPASEGMVSITFDDGFVSQYLIAQPKLNQYGYRATIFPIVDLVDSNASYMTSLQIQNLHNVLGWEVGVHAYNASAHNATGGFPGIGATATETQFKSNLLWLRQKGIYRGPELFAWPQGRFDPATLQVAREYFRVIRTTNFGTGTGCAENRYPPDVTKLKCRTVGAETAATINTLIDNAATNKEWLILLWHDVNGVGNMTQTNFNSVIDHINSNGIKCRTIGEALTLA